MSHVAEADATKHSVLPGQPRRRFREAAGAAVGPAARAESRWQHHVHVEGAPQREAVGAGRVLQWLGFAALAVRQATRTVDLPNESFRLATTYVSSSLTMTGFLSGQSGSRRQRQRRTGVRAFQEIGGSVEYPRRAGQNHRL